MNIWEKLTRAVVFLLIAAGVLAVCGWYLPLIRQNERLRKVIMNMDGQIAMEIEKNKNLRAALDANYNDPKTIERLARTHLGYARTGEYIIRFEAPLGSTNQPQPRR